MKAGLKHNAVEEKLKNIEEQVGLGEEDEITMQIPKFQALRLKQIILPNNMKFKL